MDWLFWLQLEIRKPGGCLLFDLPSRRARNDVKLLSPLFVNENVRSYRDDISIQRKLLSQPRVAARTHVPREIFEVNES